MVPPAVTRALAAAAAAHLASCATPAGAPVDESAGRGEATVVFGVEPRYSVQIHQGWVDADGWSHNRWFGAAATVSPQAGYAIVRLAPREGSTYGIMRAHPDGTAGERYQACTGDTVYTFTVPARAVVYLGNLFIEREARIRYSSDLQAAKKQLAAVRPDLAGRMVESEMKPLRLANFFCSRMTPSQ